jgi:hypothetical protein
MTGLPGLAPPIDPARLEQLRRDRARLVDYVRQDAAAIDLIRDAIWQYADVRRTVRPIFEDAAFGRMMQEISRCTSTFDFSPSGSLSVSTSPSANPSTLSGVAHIRTASLVIEPQFTVTATAVKIPVGEEEQQRESGPLGVSTAIYLMIVAYWLRNAFQATRGC